MTEQQLSVLESYFAAARRAGHIFPDYAACEAVLESAWGTSQLARECHNLFGQKCPAAGPPPGVLKCTLPTQEFLHGQWITVTATWLWFPSDDEAFRHRMSLLESLPAYADALHALSGEDFVVKVSRVWATDPERAEKVLAIHKAHQEVFV
jgi:flagellum-specific peptidoglycan hydrolase FlgJ